MTASKKFTLENQKEWAAEMSAWPKIVPQEISKKELVAGMAEAIKTAEKNGYSLTQIADFLKGKGAALSGTTLKTYLQGTKPAAKRPKKETVATVAPGHKSEPSAE